MKIFYVWSLLLSSMLCQAQIKILFDASKAESAGNADWVIDSDAHNLGFPGGTASVGTGSESNPQITPTPTQAAIIASTPETYWDGALSNWAVDCVKQGYTVESLRYNGQITYGVPSNLQDLTHYKVFVIDEPNILFTASEKNAIVTFVQNGGGLCIISDHSVSDRNNDGVDSPQVLNDLMANNSVQINPFGIAFDYVDISGNSSNFANLPGNPILHGTFGNVTQVLWSGGTTMTLNPAQNSAVTGLIFKSGNATTGTANVMCASATYMAGKVIAIGDSSIADDGTGDSGDTLYNGYTGDANGNHQKLLINSIIWLATPNPLAVAVNSLPTGFTIESNPIENRQLILDLKNNNNLPFEIFIYDLSGRSIKSVKFENGQRVSLPLNELSQGIYVCKIAIDDGLYESHRFIINK